jgi:DNA polymerase II small subunit/DNA polymerase delta subunit B
MNLLKRLVDEGFLVEESAMKLIERISEERFKALIEQLRRNGTFIVSKDTVRKILRKGPVVLREFKPVDRFSIHEYVKQLNKRYNFLQNILIKKLELSNVISINKCSIGTVSVIGFVKEREERGDTLFLTLEDPTGEIRAVVEKERGKKIEEDDVIAVSGSFDGKIIKIDKILYPDIPLRPVNYSEDDISVSFLNEGEGKGHKTTYNIFFNKVVDNLENKEIWFNPPAFVKIENITILIAPGFDPLTILRKRFINHENTDFLIEQIPDILFTDRGEVKNYKGVSLVTPGSIVNLKTREVKKI